MEIGVFAEAATPNRTRKQSFSEASAVKRSRKNAASKTLQKQVKDVPSASLGRSAQKRARPNKSTKKKSGSETPVRSATYRLPEFTDKEVDWSNMSPPQSNFQLTRTPVKRTTDQMGGEELLETKRLKEDDTDVVTAVTTITFSPEQVQQPLPSDQITDGVVVGDDILQEVTLTADGCDDVVVSTEVVVFSSPDQSILIPSHKQDATVLPATLQCTDNDLAYLERMNNIKLYKELTHKSSQLDKELKSVNQEIEEWTYKCQKADEEYAELRTANKKAAIMVYNFLKEENTTQEVSKELQPGDDLLLDKQMVEQVRRIHKEVKIELQSVTRLLEKKKKAVLEKQRTQTKGTVEDTATLQEKKKQLIAEIEEMDKEEAELTAELSSVQQHISTIEQEEKCRFNNQLRIVKERCELYIQREKNMKQIADYMETLERTTEQEIKSSLR